MNIPRQMNWIKDDSKKVEFASIAEWLAAGFCGLLFAIGIYCYLGARVWLAFIVGIVAVFVAILTMRHRARRYH